MLVSALEKNAEQKISPASIENSKPSGASFKAGFDLGGDSVLHLEEKAEWEQALWVGLCAYLFSVQYQLQNEFRAKKSEHQQREARKGQAHRGFAAPAQLIVPPQQRGK